MKKRKERRKRNKRRARRKVLWNNRKNDKFYKN